MPRTARPTKEQLAAAYGKTIPDVLAPGLDVVFCGINPGLWSAAVGRHFARPGNRFWPAIHQAGFTPELFTSLDQDRLPAYGMGITNIVARGTARADELTSAELAEGGAELKRKITRLRPAWLAVLGVGAYRTAFGVKAATVGPQPDRLGATRVWLLPNPSGLNAHYTLDKLAAEYARLRAVVPPRT
ncbi:G/U mismatch-specific DNA glycosylase [Hamadaea tsunoensis]|uniref:G/U mismatch-specific DNA glycosylase n=1 Tax=Hamadaea tsunoensis TaxID=53368 RepID=UPI00041ACB6B|nr:G/U mismatch-specific DNA glycosylase [Hamadaea tsunoensis]